MNKKKWWNRWVFTQYRLSIIKRNPYKEVLQLKLSSGRVILLFATLIVVFIILITVLIAFTDLREYIPGYLGKDIRYMMIENRLKLDSIEEELEKRNRYLLSLRYALHGESEDEIKADTLVAEVKEDTIDSEVRIRLRMSDVEKEFREYMEAQERFNLSVSSIQTNANKPLSELRFFPPVEGFVVHPFDLINNHYGIDIVGESEAEVRAVMDGVVLMAEWTLNSGYTLVIQHKDNFISIYGHNSVLIKHKGDSVLAGELIAIVGNTGEMSSGPHLHFELWRRGVPLDPQKFITFK